MTKTLSLALFAFIFFFGNLASAAESKPNEADDSRLRLGAIVPLSGPLAFFGNDFIRAFDLVKAEHPEIEKGSQGLLGRLGIRQQASSASVQ
jgi:hypothetical protein